MIVILLPIHLYRWRQSSCSMLCNRNSYRGTWRSLTLRACLQTRPKFCHIRCKRTRAATHLTHRSLEIVRTRTLRPASCMVFRLRGGPPGMTPARPQSLATMVAGPGRRRIVRLLAGTPAHGYNEWAARADAESLHSHVHKPHSPHQRDPNPNAVCTASGCLPSAYVLLRALAGPYATP